MKLYAVTLEMAMSVVADNRGDAIRIATRRARDEDADAFEVSRVQEGAVAEGWTDKALPYSERACPNTIGTIGQWRAAGKVLA